VANDNWQPDFKEWAPGEYEQRLPESWDDFSAGNRLKRVERLTHHIRAGADRTLCRQFVYTEEEWRSGCRNAGHEPNHGWIMQPGTEARTAPQPTAAPANSDLKTIGALVQEAFDDELPF
jgi:hypothetical protein